MTKILIDRAVVEQALEALEQSNRFVWHYAVGKDTIRKAQACDDAIAALRETLAEPVQERQTYRSAEQERGMAQPVEYTCGQQAARKLSHD